MNLNKNMKIYLIFTLVVMFFCCPQIYAYYSKNDSKSVTIGTKDLIITGSTSTTTYAADSNGVVSIPVTIKNDSGFAVNYNLTLSNTNLKFNDGKTVYSGTIAANTTSTVTLKIVEVNPLGTENTDIDMAVTGPYTKTIDIGSYVLTYDLTPPSCSFSTSSTVLTGNTTTVSVTCTDASGVKTTSLATSAISLKSSLGTLSNPTVTSVTNGYKYSFTYTAGSKAGTETFTLIAGKVSDNVNNTNAATTGTITVQRQVKGTFNINGASSFTYNGTKYTSTTTLTLCTLSSETTCSVTMPTITASTNTPTVIGWSTAAGTHTATYTSGQTVSISNDVTLYAQTTKAEITRKVTFGCNGGSGTVASTSCTISATYNGTAQGTSCAVTLPTSGCTYSGWNFQGWNTSDTATTGVTGSVSISSNKTYYAIWKKNAITYTLSFNTNLINNAGICSASATAPATQSCQIAAVYNGATQATSCTVTIPTLFDYQTGEWDFNGWGTSSSSTSGVDSGSQVTLSSNKTLYATWAKPVTLRFNANGCATETKTVSQTLYNFNVNSTVTVPSVTMNTNWTSLGVSSSASSTSQGTAIGSSMSYNTQCSNSVHDFYYNCKKDVTVTFNANSCTSASGSVTKTLYNGATSTTVTVPTKDMINTTWNTLGASASASSTSQGTAMGSSMTISSIGSSTTSVNRYYNCYKEVGVNFYSNYCTTDAGWVNSTIYNGATSVTVSMPTDYTAESGRTIKGASTDGSSHSASSTVTVPLGNLTNSIGYAYFICTRNFDIIFKANGCATGDKTVSKTLYSKDDSFTVDVPAPTMKTGWTNLGAASSSTATSGSTSTVSVSTSGYYTSETFYYTCTKPAITYTATYNCNGGTGNVSSTSCTIDAVYNGESQALSCSVTAPTSGCTYSGWDFQGWNASSTATSGFTGAVDITKNHTWYAIWKKPSKKYTVTFYGNGGSGSTASESCTIDAAYNGDDQATSCYIEYPENGFTYSGWTFNGWASSASYTGGNTPGAVLAISADTPRYATWKKDVTVTFNANGCTTTSPTASMTLYNGATSGSVTVPSATEKTSWTLLGASTSASSTSSGTSIGSSMTISGVASSSTTATRYFNCSKDITVTFKANGCTTADGTATKTLYNGTTSTSVTVPTKNMNTGWTSLGASTSSSSTSQGTAMDSSMSLTVATSVKTLTRYYNCVKAAKNLTVSYNCTQGTTDPESSSCTIPAVYNGATQDTSCTTTLADNTCTYSGWTFAGWGTYSGATSGSSAGASVTLTTSLTKYAIWKKVVTVQFNRNNCTVSDGDRPEVTIYNGATSLTTTVTAATSIDSWTSLGVSASSSSTSQGIAVGGSITITGIGQTQTSVERYRNCKKDVTVTFKANGCTTDDGTVTKTLYNGATSTSVTVPSATMNSGWTTLGASASSSSTSQGTAMSSSMSITGIDDETTSITRYYNCSKAAKTLTAKFSCNAGSGTVANDTCQIAAVYNGTAQATSCTVTLPSSGCTLSGWDFLGWNISSSGITGGKGDISINEDKQYYAIFKKDAITRSMSYDCNGGTGSMSPSTCTIPAVYNGEEQDTYCTVNYANNACTYSGWSFQGWNSSSSATGGITSGTVALYSNQTRYAVWKKAAITYTLSFASAASGASGSTASTSCTIPAVYNGDTQNSYCSVTLPSNGFTYSGWTFNGWGSYSTSKSGSAVGATVALTSDQTRYATWIKSSKTYTITYSSATADATVTSAATSCTIDAAYNGGTQATTCNVTLPSSGYSFAGWTFNGWGTSSSSTSGTSAGTEISISASGTRYATWMKPSITYTASFSSAASGATVTSASTSCTIDAVYNGIDQSVQCTITLPSTGYSYSGWTFNGWGTSSSSTSGSGAGTSKYISANLTFYATWKKSAITYTATYDCNGGSGSVSSTSCTIPAVYNGASQASKCGITAPASGCTYSGWSFQGWNASSSGTTGFTGAIEISKNHTYYAIWKKSAITYTLSFLSAASGASGSTASKTCTIPAVYNGDTQDSYCSVTLPSNGFTYSGWTFNGWGSYSSSTSGSAVGATVGLTSNQTRYATWVKSSKTITVSYNCTNGSGSTASTSCTIPAVYNGTTQDTSCDVALASNNCSYSGWTFVGWGTYSGATSGTSAGTTISVSSAQTRYAVWRKTLTLTCSKGANVSSIGATSKTCYVYNGSTSGCSVTLPSITPNSGYTSVGWGTSSGATSGTAAGSSITITANTTRYANATDQTAPTCGTVTGAGTSSTWRQSRTITVACSETSGSGCSQDSFSQTFNSGTHTSGTITISDAAGNTRNCTVATYIDNTDPTCGRIEGASTEWSKSKTIRVACTDEHSTCVNSEYSQTFNSGTATTKSIYIYDSAGNSTACTVNAYIDNTAPSCGTVTGASTTWSTTSRNISVACSETSGSGCAQSSYSKTFTDTKVGTITISDAVGNSANCSVNAYVDTTGPSCGTVTGASTTWITSGNREISVACSDSVSGCTQSSFSYIFIASRQTGTITIKNNAGITRDCTVNVYIDTVAPTCGTVTNGSTSWRNTTQSISIGCSDSVSGCQNTTVSKSFSNTGIGTITITDNAGNTKDCSVNAYVDTTAPTCGTVTNGSTSWRNTTQSISVACSDNLSSCTSTSFSGNFSNATTGSITISDNAGNTKSCSVNAYVDIYAPTCGTVTNGSTSWRNTTQTISVACSDTGSLSGCTQSSFSSNFSNSKTSTITISDNAGNTKACSVNAYVDIYAPTCGTVTNGSTSWRNTSQSISVACSDTGVSGCTSTSFSQTFSNATTGTIQISDAAGNTKSCSVNAYVDTTAPTCSYSGTGATEWKNTDRTFCVNCSDSLSDCTEARPCKTFTSTATTGTITVYDNAGNSKTCTSFNVYIDKSKPTISCTVNSGGTSGVSATVTTSDSGGSGWASNPAGSKSGLTSTTTYTAKDNAGNSASCTITVTSSIYNYTRDRYSCTTGTYSLNTSGYVQTCTAKSKATADANNSSNYTNCYSRTDAQCEAQGLSSGCQYRYYYTRTGCSAYSSSVGYTSTVTSCSESSSSYYKYTCTVKSYTYSGSA